MFSGDRFGTKRSRFERLTSHGRPVDEDCYTGLFYILPMTEQEKKKAAVINLCASLLMLAALCAAGFFDTASSHTFYVLFPVLFILVPIGYMIAGSFSFFFVPKRMQKYHYEISLARIHRAVIGMMILSVIALVLEIVFILTGAEKSRSLKEAVVVFMLISEIFMGFFYGKWYEKKYGGLLKEPSHVTLS